jgi:ketosteroid isomerase-like protein
MYQRALTILIFAIAFDAASFAAANKSASKAAAPAPDKAYLQKIWDGWATLDPANVAQFYAQGPNTFFDITPLKYSSWDEYQQGVKQVLAGYQSASLTVNDDAAVHQHGDLVWATATVKNDMTTKTNKHEMGNFRWTAIFEKQDGKWLIIHEHVSAPIQ